MAAGGRRGRSPDHPARRGHGPGRREPYRRRRLTRPSGEFLDLQAALAGEYSLQRELGRGGMGVVYLARDVQLDRDVAIKVLPAQLASDPTARL